MALDISAFGLLHQEIEEWRLLKCHEAKYMLVCPSRKELQDGEAVTTGWTGGSKGQLSSLDCGPWAVRSAPWVQFRTFGGQLDLEGS